MYEESELPNQQLATCNRVGATFVPCDLDLKVGVSRNLQSGVMPINAMRTNPDSATSGWYIWAGEYSSSPEFFVPLHGHHLKEWAPKVLPYLGLPPGWRFLLADDYEDVWADPEIQA